MKFNQTFLSIIQSISTIITGSVIGLILIWKLALVGIGEFSGRLRTVSYCLPSACMPLVLSTGYIRLVSVEFVIDEMELLISV